MHSESSHFLRIHRGTHQRLRPLTSTHTYLSVPVIPLLMTLKLKIRQSYVKMRHHVATVFHSVSKIMTYEERAFDFCGIQRVAVGGGHTVNVDVRASVAFLFVRSPKRAIYLHKVPV